jgi:hypothetical protein
MVFISRKSIYTRVTAAVVVLVVMTIPTSTLAWGPNDPDDASADPDGDRLGNLDEFRAGSNPLNPDTDNGGCWDGWEVLYGMDPTDPLDDLMDTDNDGWSNFREYLEGTNPLNPNTDGDLYVLDSTDPHPLKPDDRGETGPTWPWPSPEPPKEQPGNGNGMGQGEGEGQGTKQSIGQGNGQGQSRGSGLGAREGQAQGQGNSAYPLPGHYRHDADHDGIVEE